MDDQTPEGDVAVVEADETRKDYSQADRDKMAKSGQALPDGSFPIANEADLKNAIQAYGRASNQAAAKAHIIKRAKALGLTSLLPDGWEQNSDDPGLEYRQALAGSLKGSREVREFTVDGMECRALDDGTMRMSGYASLTEEPYQIGSEDRGFEETIARGAFKRSLGEGPDTVLLINHDGIPLAGTRNGSLALAEDARGLHWTADLDPADPDSQMLARKVDSGLLNQCSFAFVATGEKWSDDMRQRRITSVSIHRGDVSVVTNGANPNTTVGLRDMVGAMEDRAADEIRASKTLSAASRTEIEAARDRLTNLLNGADTKPDPDETPDNDSADDLDGRAADASEQIKAAAEKVLVGRKVELDLAFERRRQQMELLKRKAGPR
jgi:HK97 family phage prohead protease